MKGLPVESERLVNLKNDLKFLRLDSWIFQSNLDQIYLKNTLWEVIIGKGSKQEGNFAQRMNLFSPRICK